MVCRLLPQVADKPIACVCCIPCERVKILDEVLALALLPPMHDRGISELQLPDGKELKALFDLVAAKVEAAPADADARAPTWIELHSGSIVLIPSECFVFSVSNRVRAYYAECLP